MLRAVLAGSSACLLLFVGVVWRMSRRSRPEAHIGFAPERKELDSQYDIVEPLGEGGMGTIYKGWDKVLKRPVAIKSCATSCK
ncbi:MAG: hypothetical protein M0D55_09535 [Elusimicrobiota bacterium]|nr:MAG: hypothetical protein M0D55_09535 [Elusimicrobiota bacterium]